MNPVGLFWAPDEPRGDVRVGRRVATDDFVAALAKHTSRDVRLYVPPGAAELGAAIAEGRPRVSVHDRTTLARGGAFSAWHELALEPFTPFELRRRLGGTPWPVTVAHHSLSYRELLGSLLTLLMQPTRPFDVLVCSSTAARDALLRLVAHVRETFAARHGVTLAFHGRAVVIPLGVDVERFAPGDPAPGRASLGVPDAAFVMLWVGRLSAIDKADLLPLVQMLSELRRDRPSSDVRLVCVGTERPGEGSSEAIRACAGQAGVADAVTIRTDVGDDLPRAYAAADVFVSPVDNVQESFGLAPVEAMACGVPQVVSSWSGYRDTVSDGETGWLVPTRWAACTTDLDEWAFLSDTARDHLTLAQSVAVDMGALRRAVERLIDDAGLRRSMGERSRARAVEQFSLARVIARHEDLWDELGDLARRDPPAPPDATPSCETPRYHAAFGPFASHALSPKDGVALTARGRDFVAGTARAPLYYARWDYLRPEILNAVLSALVSAGESRRVLAGQLVAAARTACSASRDAVMRHLLWLVKYDLLAVEPAESPGASGSGKAFSAGAA